MDDRSDNARLGQPVPGWTAPPRPPRKAMRGRYCTVEPLSASLQAVELHRANAADPAIWDYLPYGPFDTPGAYQRWVREMEASDDPLFFAVCPNASGRAAGVMSYLRIAPEAGSIELGHINLSAELQRTQAATEAMTLMIGWAFQAGYRRFEWKCNALNHASRRAAERLGLSYEGVFRQAAVIKGRNRDTAWFAAIDSEWPSLKAAYAAWLAPENFDAGGRQILSLGELTRDILVSADPVLAGSVGC
ncbi:MAG: GNAT family protein [Pseudomonadota bacterium]